MKLEILDGISRNLKNMEYVDFNSVGDIACIMKSKEKLGKVRAVLLATAIPFGIMEWISILLWSFNYHWKNISCICPHCHAIFRPGKREAFFARHTPITRKLTCTCCGRKGFCVETGCKEE